MENEIKILLTAVLYMIFGLPLAFAHWFFSLAWVASVVTFLYLAVKLIWGL